MVAEQEVSRLNEIKVRMERLLSYYREMGERAFVEELELRMRSVSDTLRGHSGASAC